MRKLLLFVFVLSCFHCGKEKEQSIAVMKIEKATFEVTIDGDGSLQATKSTKISMPSDLQSPLTIGWIHDEGGLVRKGDVIFRFDDQELKKSEREANVEITKLEYESEQKTRTNKQDAKDLTTDLSLTKLERNQAETFAPKDERLYSREEIIESDVNLKYLDAKIGHYEVKQDRQDKKNVSDKELLGLKMQNHQLTLEQVDKTKSILELKAPHDGYFFLNKTWRGKPKVGDTAWNNQQLAKLPALEKMEAKVYVLEVEAAGLSNGLEAQVFLDSAPGVIYKAKIKKVDALAKPIVRNNPIKYFEVILDLEKTEPEVMKPGGYCKAKIFVTRQENVISVPNQALFQKDSETWVYLKDGQHFKKQLVTLGERSVTRTLIKEGLHENQEIALSLPPQEAIK